MTTITTFAPVPGACKGYAASSSSGSTAFQITKMPQADIYIYNSSSSDPMFFELGGSAVAATEATTGAAGSLIIPPSTLQIIRGQRGDNSGIYGAVIMSSGKTGTLFVAPGNGA